VSKQVTVANEGESPRNPKRGPGNSKPLKEPVQADGYFRRHDLARRYRVSLVTIWQWTREGRLPAPIRVSRALLWPVPAILKREAEWAKTKAA
jgi:predicted DNA-binding transcriptional regulator AlpA